MLGFRWTKSKEVATGIESYTEYSQDFPYTGMAVKSETRLANAGNAGVLKRSTSTPNCKIPLSGAACVIQTRCDQSANSAACLTAANSRYYPYVQSTQEESWDLGSEAYPVLSTVTEYGLNTEGKFYGDPTKVTSSVVGGGSKSSVQEYWAADEGNWVLGRLKKATVTSTVP